jgi:hypothetical protein
MTTQKRSHRNSSVAISTPSVIGVHFKIGRKIGEGSFGIIYEGKRERKEKWAWNSQTICPLRVKKDQT